MVQLSVSHIDVALGKKEPKRILTDVSFEAETGEFVSLLGASGAGKSTLLKIIAGILVQDAGSVAFDGACVDSLPAHKRKVGYVFQDMRLFPTMNVEDNVAFPCKMQGMPKRERRAWAHEMLASVQLEGFGARDVASLSGGQKQRVALARALAGKPDILLLDEPFSGLDEHLRDDMRSLVLRLHRSLGMTTIMVTHDAVEAIEMSDRIVYLDGGAVVQRGTPRALFERPASRAIAACFGNCSTLEGVVEQGVFKAGALRIPAAHCAEGAATAVVRHAGVSIAPGAETVLSVRCCVYCGNGNLARLDVEGQTLTVPVQEVYEQGERVSVRFDPHACFVYPRENCFAKWETNSSCKG